MSLSYSTIESVDDSVIHSVKHESTSISHDWWAESICFFKDPEGKGRLYGDTKLLLGGYSTPNGKFRAISPDDDSLMAMRDATIVIDFLCKKSLMYKVNWELSYAGTIFGKILNGTPDEGCAQFIKLLFIAADTPEESKDVRMKYLSEKYKDRWD